MLVVEANAGQKFGPMTMQCLTQMDVMVAFAFEDYGQKTASKFCSYYEVDYAHQNNVPIIPLKLYDGAWPPQPDPEGGAQNRFVFRRDLVYKEFAHALPFSTAQLDEIACFIVADLEGDDAAAPLAPLPMPASRAQASPVPVPSASQGGSAPPKWHGSMSGQETGPIVLQVTNEVQKAGGEFTLAHFQDEGWFAEWKRKLWEAGGVVIIFSDKYRGRFTEALQMEAAEIMRRREEDAAFKLFVFDPAKDQATTIRANIQDGAPHMGDIDTWEKFARDSMDSSASDGAQARGGPSGGTTAAATTVSAEDVERLKAAVAETQQVRARRKSSASYIPPVTRMTPNATPITLKAAVQGRRAAKKIKVPVSSGFDALIQHLAKKFKCDIDAVSYVDEDGDEIDIDDDDTWVEAAQGALEHKGVLKVQVTLAG